MAFSTHLKLISCHFQLFCLHFVSHLSPQLDQTGGLATGILIMRRKWEKRKPWKEISLEMCPLLLSSASTPSSLSPLQPLNFYSQASHQAGPSMESRKLDWEMGACLQAKAAGMRCLPRRRWPLSQLWAGVKLTAMFKRPGGNYRVWKTWVYGAQRENQHSVDEHNNTHCPFWSLHMGNN